MRKNLGFPSVKPLNYQGCYFPSTQRPAKNCCLSVNFSKD